MKKFYYTIGEVSNLIEVKPHVIRYWENEFSALRPKKAGGRIRKYSEDHILLLKKIKDMLYNQRFTIEGARQKLKNERHAISNIASDAVSSNATAEAPHSQSPSSISGKQLSTVLDSIRNDLNSLKSLCEIHIKDHK